MNSKPTPVSLASFDWSLVPADKFAKSQELHASFTYHRRAHAHASILMGLSLVDQRHLLGDELFEQYKERQLSDFPAKSVYRYMAIGEFVRANFNVNVQDVSAFNFSGRALRVLMAADSPELIEAAKQLAMNSNTVSEDDVKALQAAQSEGAAAAEEIASLQLSNANLERNLQALQASLDELRDTTAAKDAEIAEFRNDLAGLSTRYQQARDDLRAAEARAEMGETKTPAEILEEQEKLRSMRSSRDTLATELKTLNENIERARQTRANEAASLDDVKSEARAIKAFEAEITTITESVAAIIASISKLKSQTAMSSQLKTDARLLAATQQLQEAHDAAFSISAE